MNVDAFVFVSVAFSVGLFVFSLVELLKARQDRKAQLLARRPARFNTPGVGACPWSTIATAEPLVGGLKAHHPAFGDRIGTFYCGSWCPCATGAAS